jgi:hypothetical protein
METTMNETTGFESVPAPTHPSSEFIAYEAECREALQPLVAHLLEMAESAGWNRRIAASTLMFLAAQQVSAAPHQTASDRSEDGTS